MDLKILVFLLFILFTAGHSLSCYECMSQNGSCANQTVQTCSNGTTHCLSSTAMSQDGDITSTLKFKHCAVDCQSWSVNLGIIKMTTSCCNTDQCNDQDAPDPSNVTIPNGKTCFSCDGQNCTNILNCSGSEDYCIIAETFGNKSLVQKGCASKSVCDSTTLLRNVRCCEENLCNGAATMNFTQNSTYSVNNSVTPSSTYSVNNSVTPSSTYSVNNSVTVNSTYNSTISVTPSSTYSVNNSVTPSSTYSVNNSVTVNSTYNSTISVTQNTTYNSPNTVTPSSTYNVTIRVTQNTTYNSTNRVTPSSTYNNNSVSQNTTYNSTNTITPSSTHNRVQSVTQGFLFLCCSLLSYFLLH